MTSRKRVDRNKFQVLQEVEYRVFPSCSMCKHSTFPQDDWGTCDLHEYDHDKHGDTRKLSIHKCGGCPRFERDYSRTARLGAFATLLDQANEPDGTQRMQTVTPF